LANPQHKLEILILDHGTITEIDPRLQDVRRAAELCATFTFHGDKVSVNMMPGQASPTYGGVDNWSTIEKVFADIKATVTGFLDRRRPVTVTLTALEAVRVRDMLVAAAHRGCGDNEALDATAALTAVTKLDQALAGSPRHANAANTGSHP
jgi:hypothetical protein